MPAKLFRPEQAPVECVLTCRDVLVLYLRYARSEGTLCQKALRNRESLFGRFAEQVGDLLISELKAYHLTEFIEWHGWAPTTRKLKANEIKAAFNWAADRERIVRSPFARVRYRGGERRPDLPDAALAQIIANAPPLLTSVLRFLRLTGCRVGEAMAAKWGDVNLELGIWKIPFHKTRKRTGKPKTVALVAEAVELLKTNAHAVAPEAPACPSCVLQTSVTASAHIFLNSQGRPWKHGALLGRVHRIAKRLNLGKVTMHGIRHRFGSAAVAAGAPIKLIAQQLGHASVSTTERYYCDVSGEIDAMRAAAGMGQPSFG